MPDLDTLEQVQRRVLWLAVRMVDHANRERPAGAVKVGGHQSSSASLVTVMTALWFAHLDGHDLVSVKPHAAPVLHAINYLLGDLDRSYLTTLRSFGGLQAYPSLTKDPDRVDFSTGSVGIGPAAPLFAAASRRYVDAHFGPRDHSRFVAILGDAELDEGNVWESVADPALSGLGNVMWIVDVNRQSLDRVIPGARIGQWSAQFRAAGWHVVEAKYGRRLRQAFASPGGECLRDWIDAMPNEQYQSVFGLDAGAGRARFLDGAPDEVAAFLAPLPDDDAVALVTDLGGHDLPTLLDAYADCDERSERPSVVFAYTIKGWGLPTAGHPRNHSALLDAGGIAALRGTAGPSGIDDWAAFEPDSAAGALCAERARVLRRRSVTPPIATKVPTSTGARSSGITSTQEAFGRVVSDLSRSDDLRSLLVTTAPDVATSTSLGGFINRVGVFAPEPRRAWSDDALVKWAEGPSGQHIELGISEMNLFMMLGALGRSGDLNGQPLIPIGTVYDPFVLRGLDALIHGAYSGSRFVVAGTPSGVTLAPEGGAHQSTITASVGIELPGVVLHEPAFAAALDWLLCDAVSHVAGPAADPASDTQNAELVQYFRLSTRPVDQRPFDLARTRLGDAVLRRHVLSGAYRLVDGRANLHAPAGGSGDGHQAPTVHLVACGAVLPDVLAAADELAAEGIVAHVVDITSPGRLYRGWQRAARQAVRSATTPPLPGTLRAAFPESAPIVSVHDASSHALAWIGSALGMPQVALGVDGFGQSGTIEDLHRAHDLDSGSIINGALAALGLDDRLARTQAAS